MLHNKTMSAFVIVTYFVTTFALLCFKLDKKVPVNYILLGIFTFCVSYMVSVACVRTNPKVVLQAACLTLAMTTAITVYAMTTKTDFTIFGPILFIVGFVFCIASILFSFFGYTPGLGWSIIGVILFSFYLLFDVQMIMGGDKKRYQFDEDSYIMAAVALYIDIVNIFMYLLNILNDK